MRFLGAMNRTRAKQIVRLVNVDSQPGQAQGIKSVPTLLENNQRPLVGTAAFEWLKQFDGDSELESFMGGAQRLGFSDYTSNEGFIEFTEAYGTFEPPTS